MEPAKKNPIKKRVALVYSGQPRYLKECHASHKSAFYEQNPDWEIDTFGHIWHEDTQETREGEALHSTGKTVRQKERTTAFDRKNFIREHWKPKKIFFETPRRFKFARDLSKLKPGHQIREQKLKPWGPTQLSNTLSMLYSMEKANDLKKSYEKECQFKYDCVVRIRTDYHFELPIGCPKNINPMKALDEYDLSKLNVQELNLKLLNYPDFCMDDMFAFSNSAVMDKFFSVFSNVGDFPDYLMWNNHYIVGYHVAISEKIPMQTHPWFGNLIRKKHKSLEIYSLSKKYFYELRKKTIQELAGNEIAREYDSVLLWLSGMPGPKVSLDKILDLTSFYINAGLLAEYDKKPLQYCKRLIQRDPSRVTHGLLKIKKGQRAYVLRQQLTGAMGILKARIGGW